MFPDWHRDFLLILVYRWIMFFIFGKYFGEVRVCWLKLDFLTIFATKLNEKKIEEENSEKEMEHKDLPGGHLS